MRHDWSLADLLDLEFLFSRDQELLDKGGDKDLSKRDRSIYLEIKDSCRQQDDTDRRSCLLHQWLSVRRAALPRNDARSVLPGRLFRELIGICSWVFFLFALAGGWGLAMSYLSYSGKTPVNVAAFLGLFVGTQLLLLLVLLFFITAGRLRTSPRLPLAYSLVRKAVFRLAVKLGRLSKGSESYQWLVGLSGSAQKFGDLYGLLFALPFFSLVQLAGIGFNLGVLGATLLKVVATDVAFGWQSTLQPGAEAVLHLVKIIALPWSWALPAGIGYPDLAQIQGSQMILKEGIYRLSTGNLVSWWPFLCLAVAVYGLLPRVILFAGGRFGLRLLIQRFKFDSAAHRQVLRRMMTPRLSTTTTVVSPEKQELPLTEPVEKGAFPTTGKQVMALIPDEIFAECPHEELARFVRNRLGAELGPCLRINQPEDNEEQVLDEIRRSITPETDVMILQEAWQPPIEEFFAFIDQLRKTVGKKVLLSIMLIGKPTPETIFTEVRGQDYTIWQQKIISRGDPYMQSIRLVNA
jgi:hypothetical protein